MELFQELTLRTSYGGYPAGTVGIVVDVPAPGFVTIELGDDTRREDDTMGVLDVPVTELAEQAVSHAA